MVQRVFTLRENVSSCGRFAASVEGIGWEVMDPFQKASQLLLRKRVARVLIIRSGRVLSVKAAIASGAAAIASWGAGASIVVGNHRGVVVS